MAAEEKAEEREGMTPWEQHSSVISIPRFDYKAPSSLINHSHSGFLITCTIRVAHWRGNLIFRLKAKKGVAFLWDGIYLMYVKPLPNGLEREKSATKEAISILEKYMGSLSSDRFEMVDPADVNVTAKRRKICSEETDGEDVKISSSMEAANALGEVTKDTPSPKIDAGAVSSSLSLVKLTRSGLLLFTCMGNKSLHTVDILSKIFHSLDCGSLKPPLWCHRIIPIQATCNLKEKELHMAVSKLVREYLGDERNNHEGPIRFAVGYSRRGIDETEIKIQKNTIKDSDEVTLLDRNKCFSVVAGAVKDAAADSVVDLKSPELAVLVELLPLSGVPNSSLVVALSVLPHNLITVKPRLYVKALVSDAKAIEGKNKKQGHGV